MEKNMIKLPDFSKSFEYENNFYLSCDSSRMSKVLAHYELFKAVQGLPGAVVECGLFKGLSFIRFAHLRELFNNPYAYKLIGFDTFAGFPKTDFKDDEKHRDVFIKTAGEQSIGEDQLWEVLRHKGLDKNVELIKGDIVETVPQYVKDNPHLKISLLNLDTDIYEPAKIVLENLWDRIVKGGILISDDYNVFPGETKVMDDFFKDKNVTIKKFPFAMTPCYVIKQ